MPKALLLSQPLHFGDYGGLPLKIIWALLDIVTIIVLGSGFYLWLAKLRRPKTTLTRRGRVIMVGEVAMKAIRKNQPLSRIFAIPIVLNVLAAAGLAAGLFGDSTFDAHVVAAAWLCR